MQHWVIIGASGGIGWALVQQLLAQGHRVSAISRQPLSVASSDIDAAHQALTWYQLASAEDVSAASLFAEIFSTKVDAVMLCQGGVHGNGLSPEKSIKQLSRVALQQSYDINVIHPALAVQLLQLTAKRYPLRF